MTKRIAVLAGNHQQFLEYKRDHPNDHLTYCGEWPRFAGLEFHEMVEVGTFRNRKDALDIYQHVLPRVRLEQPK